MSTEIYHITTSMGSIRDNDLPFLNAIELNEFNIIGYTGRTSNDEKTNYEDYLNTLDRGNFKVVCTKSDNGDFSENYIVIQVN